VRVKEIKEFIKGRYSKILGKQEFIFHVLEKTYYFGSKICVYSLEL